MQSNFKGPSPVHLLLIQWLRGIRNQKLESLNDSELSDTNEAKVAPQASKKTPMAAEVPQSQHLSNSLGS
jgi:hypothetical protein